VQIRFPDSIYGDLGNNNVDLGADTFKAMLVTSAYTFDFAHDRRDDVTNEVVGTGYTAGGVTLTGVTYVIDGTNRRYKFDFNDPSWASSTITARGCWVYKSRGGAASADELVAFIDFEQDESSSNTEFKIQLNSVGLFVMRAG
jgi:hypothetical protein